MILYTHLFKVHFNLEPAIYASISILELMKSMSHEVLAKYLEFRSMCERHLPKVDRKLLLSLLERMAENPGELPMFTVEVFGNKPLNTEEVKEIIWSEFRKIPAFYDNGTHVVADHELSLELLERISSYPEVVAIKGEPLEGASRGPSYDIR
jgi:hypothetical protein